MLANIIGILGETIHLRRDLTLSKYVSGEDVTK